MSISSIAMIMDRIAQASPDSRIAVFATSAGLDSVFADTLTGQKRIWKDHAWLLGVWHSGSNQFEIAEKLEPYRPVKQVKRGPRVNRGAVDVSPLRFTGEL